MIKIDQYLDRLIDKKLVSLNEIERESHVSSGKLTASMLGYPLQWQILKIKGVKAKEFDKYTLRKFLRGKQIEDWLVSHMEPIDTQKYCTYKGCIGYVDALCLSDNWDFKNGVVAHEVKSVANMKYKRIIKDNQADESHILQAAFYALALGLTHCAIDYVASDDLRVITYVYEAKEYQAEIDRIIQRFDDTLASGIVPVFEPRYAWQANIEYCNYPEFMKLTVEQIKEKLGQTTI